MNYISFYGCFKSAILLNIFFEKSGFSLNQQLLA